MSTDTRSSTETKGWKARLAASARAGALQASIVLLIEIALFLWTPISRYDEVYYSAADLTQAFSLTRIEPGHQPGNQLQSDAVTQMQPWFMLNREELAAGRMGLWNRWNGAGCPHFANYQSAVFSPFSAPFYVFDFKFALLASAVMKLFALGLFTYLFLRAIRVAHVPALVGATIFTFAGHNSLLLYFPHVGAMVALPAGLYFLELALQRFEDARRAEAGAPRARLRGPLIGFTLSLWVGLLAGNPEPFYFACLLIAAWGTWRLAGLWWRAGRPDADARAVQPVGRARLAVLTLAGKVALGVLIATGLAAFQILPFFEFLNESRVLEQRSLRQTPLEWTWWPLMLFPNVVGNPGSPYKLSDAIPSPNFELVNMAYAGGAATLLAMFAVFHARRDRRALFFVLASLTWLFYAYDLFGAADLFMMVPTLDMAPMNRSQGVWNFLVAAGAALTVDHWSKREGPRQWSAALAVLLLAAAALVACLVGADRLIGEHASVDSPNHGRFLEYVPQHLHSMSFLFGATVVLGVATLLSRSRAARILSTTAIVALVFAPSGWLLRDYNPVAENRFFFPVTKAIATLQEKVGDQRLAILGPDMIPPDSNIAYHIESISNYDGMWVRDYDFLFRDHFGDGNNWRPVQKATKRALQMFGVQFVLAKWGWNFVDNGLHDFGKGGGQTPIRQEILPGRDVTQTFVARAKGLRAVMVVLSTFPSQRPCELVFRLEDLDAGVVVHEQRMTSAEIQGTVYSKRHVTWPGEYALNPHGRPVVFTFPPQAQSKGRHYKFTLSCEKGLGGDTICAWSMPKNAYGDGEARWGTKKLTGETLFDFSFDGEDVFEPVASFEDFVLYRFRAAIPEFSIVPQAITTSDESEAINHLRLPSFDPRKFVVLDLSGPEGRALYGEIERTRSERRVVQFPDSDWCYLVAPDGKTLAHVDDETTFLANDLRWDQIEQLPLAMKSTFTILPDSDVEARRRAGLRMLAPGETHTSDPVVIEKTPTYAKVQVNRLQSGYLVRSQAHFPGWRATINGESTPIFRANYAFDAVAVPAGDSIVEFRYEPESLRKGLWIGFASILVGFGLLFLSRDRAR